MKPGLVLVHGGEHGSWCWDAVIDALKWPPLAVDLPGRDQPAGTPTDLTLADSATAIVDAVGRSGFDPYMIVCHSMGGLAVLAARSLLPRPPAHRVFISALTPPPGAAGVDVLPLAFRVMLRLRLGRASGRTVHLLPRWLAKRKWCSDLPAELSQLVMERRCSEPAAIPLESTPPESAAGVRSTYVILDRDRAIAPRLQRRMAAHLPVTDIRHLDAGHEAMLSHPVALADMLNRIADEIFASSNLEQ